MNVDLKNKVALLTGASRGIGAASAKHLAACGAKVLLTARSESKLKTVVDEIVERGGDARAVVCNVGQYADVERAVGYCVKHFGALDIVLNNAGVIEPIATIAESDPAAWGSALDVNVKGVYHGLRAAIPVMLKGGGGVIINMSSGAATSALEGWSHYCASKAAVKMLSQCADKEYGHLGIRVVGLSPGTVATDMMVSIKESGVNPVSQIDWAKHIPAEWVAQTVAYLCTEDAADLRGTDFSIKTEDGRARVGLPGLGG